MPSKGKKMSSKEENNKITATTGIAALCLLNLSGLGYLAFKDNQNQLETQKQQFAVKGELLQSENQLKLLSQNQTQFQQQTTELIQQKLNHHPHATPGMFHLKWLIQQAKWQTNILNQSKTSQQLLTLANKIAEKQNLGSLQEAIEHDLTQLKQLNLTDASTLVGQISQLQMTLAKLQPAETFIKAEQAVENQLPDYLKPFQPFVQIDKLKQTNPTVIPPSSQLQIIENMQLLLPQIQYAGISHQQALFNQLTEQLANQWQMVANYFKDASINQQIETLKNDRFQLENPLRFESSAEIHLLIKQSNKSNP